MEKRTVIVWGNRIEYDYFCKLFKLEVLKGNMQICAIILNEEGLFREIDGIEVIPVERLLSVQFDYLVDMNRKNRGDILRILELLQIPREKVIPADVFCLPSFDLERWEQVKESKVSIITSHCWGGLTYNALGMEFLSPFVNMFLGNDDFFKLVENFTYYMEQPIEFVREEYEINLKRNYPVVKLGDIIIHFNHYTDFDSAVETWNKRKERINYANLFVEMTVDNEKELKRFLQLPYEHKVCFTMLPYKGENVISFHNSFLKSRYGDNAWNIANSIATREFLECKQYDALKLLNYDSDYMRVEVV